MQDPKAWVRQWIAIMMTVGLISCAAIEMLTTVSIPTWFLMIAGGCVRYNSAASAHYWTRIEKNDVDEVMVYSSGAAAAGGPHMGFVLGVVYLAAADYLELWAYQQTGADVPLQNDRSQTFMSIHKLS